MSYLSLLLASLAWSLAGPQATPGTTAVPTSLRSPIVVHLMTLADDPEMVVGQRVRVPVVGVKQAIGPRLVVVTEPRLLGIDRSYQADFRFDKLIVVLPAAIPLSHDQVITVTGEIRTLAAARSLGLSVNDRDLKDTRWAKRAVVLMADSVETVDGVPLSGGR